jgi:hypothetical protein
VTRLGYCGPQLASSAARTVNLARELADLLRPMLRRIESELAPPPSNAWGSKTRYRGAS